MATTCRLRWPEVGILGTLQQKSMLEGNPFSINSLSLFNIPKLVELYREITNEWQYVFFREGTSKLSFCCMFGIKLLLEFGLI
ncbi:hypothetical protein L2E82_10751 [Cichorium intybus]|uniref:Uncharacterized protein n=1 Tax=Cichorium intybus TaxID=13427 RepID=A0ACB9GCN9_CICIN|nr:hypothetical protein L2E82_10751 [Cichorium intybus]